MISTLLEESLDRRFRAGGYPNADVDTPLGNGPLCSAQSPDGSHECSLPLSHGDDHHALTSIVRWTQLSIDDAHSYNGKPGDWITIDPMPDNETCFIVASWPQRYDDFTPLGEPTDRRTEWNSTHDDA